MRLIHQEKRKDRKKLETKYPIKMNALCYAYAIDVLGAVATCAVNSDTRSSSGAEYYKLSLIIM